MRGLTRLTELETEVAPQVAAHAIADRGRSAAWLVWAHRRVLRRAGEVAFIIPCDVETPGWFQVAMEQLRRRQRWTVTRTTRAGIRVYVVRWMDHGTRRPHVPREVRA